MTKNLPVVFLCIALAGNAFAGSEERSDALEAYAWEVGGRIIINALLGLSTDTPVKTKAQTPVIGGNTCAKLNPKDSVGNMFLHINKNLLTLQDIPESVLLSLPGYTLCRAKPGLCQLAQDYTARLERQFRTHVTHCEKSVQGALKGHLPYADWMLASEAEMWSQAIKNQLPSLEAYLNIAHNRDQGIVWIGGIRAGGKNQKQIQPLRQIAHAGWCIAQGKKPTCEGGDRDSYYYKIWPTAPAFKAWLIAVLGDIGMWTYEGAPLAESISGHGLESVVRLQEERIAVKLKAILAKTKEQISAGDLLLLSARNMQMSVAILEALENNSQREWLEPNLVNRIAVGQTVDMALLAKKILYAGSRDYHVQKIYAARKTADWAIQRIEDEVSTLLYDNKVQNKLLQDYAQSILTVRKRIGSQYRQRTPLKPATLE